MYKVVWVNIKLGKDVGIVSVYFKGNECLNEKLLKVNIGELFERRRLMWFEIV